MTTLRDFQKKYCSRALTVSICISLIFILFDRKAIGKGLILGTIFSIINFVLIAQTLPGRVVAQKGKAFLLSLGSIFFRYVILAIPIIIAAKFDAYNLFAAAAGLFAVQIMIIFEQLTKYFIIRKKEQI